MIRIVSSTALPVIAFTLSLGAPAVSIAQSRAEKPAAGNAVTVVACVMREADYARTNTADATGSSVTQLLLSNVPTGTP